MVESNLHGFIDCFLVVCNRQKPTQSMFNEQYTKPSWCSGEITCTFTPPGILALQLSIITQTHISTERCSGLLFWTWKMEMENGKEWRFEFLHEIIEFPHYSLQYPIKKCVSVFHALCGPVLRPSHPTFCKPLPKKKQSPVGKAL